MSNEPARNPARVLAPLALVAFAIALFAVVLGSGGGDDEGSGGPAARRTTAAPTVKREGRRQKGTYTVQTGDTLAGIAEKTGVSVQMLQELNPQLDPQALVSGQKIKLRE